MRADEKAAEAWAREWSSLAPDADAEIDWEERAWRSIGRQRIPVRARFTHPDAVARFAGGAEARDWSRLRSRASVVRERFGATDAVSAAVRGNVDLLLRFGEAEFHTVVDTAAWLVEHPVAGLRPRQLPIRGVDSKWFAAHRGILTALHAAAAGSRDLGIVDATASVRLRVLDPALAVGGITDFSATPEQLAGIPYRPDVVFVFENLESVLAMPLWPGAIAVHGSGYAVDVVARIPWVSGTPVVYWGDLDSNGFAILNRLRSWHPDVTSVLMDLDTLLDCDDLWVPEPTPHRGKLDRLTAGEQQALERLHDEGDVRLEQERIPWERALSALRAAASGLVDRAARA